MHSKFANPSVDILRHICPDGVVAAHLDAAEWERDIGVRFCNSIPSSTIADLAGKVYCLQPIVLPISSPLIRTALSYLIVGAGRLDGE